MLVPLVSMVYLGATWYELLPHASLPRRLSRCDRIVLSHDLASYVMLCECFFCTYLLSYNWALGLDLYGISLWSILSCDAATVCSLLPCVRGVVSYCSLPMWGEISHVSAVSLGVAPQLEKEVLCSLTSAIRWVSFLKETTAYPINTIYSQYHRGMLYVRLRGSNRAKLVFQKGGFPDNIHFVS